MLQQQDLEGKYTVKSETSLEGPFVANGDGMTEIKDGLTFRKDKNNCIWESSFSLLDDNKVQLESSVDPSHAGENFYLLDDKGQKTSGIVVYRSVLDVKKLDGKVVMSGTIKHGTVTTRLTMTQV